MKKKSLIIGLAVIDIVLISSLVAYASPLLRPGTGGGTLAPINLNQLQITAASPLVVDGVSSSSITGDGTASKIGGALSVSTTLAVGTTTQSVSLSVDTVSSTVRIGSAIHLTSCLEMQDMSTTTLKLTYNYVSSTTWISTTTKPIFCE